MGIFKKIKLLPCPFCGNADLLDIPDDGYMGLYWVSCSNCGAEGPTTDAHAFPKTGKDLAKEKWNHRMENC